jgi:hypothetical protein
MKTYTDEQVIEIIKDRLAHARREHPEGTEMSDVDNEWLEYASEPNGTIEEQEEALDVIATLIRYALQNGDVQ